jgi:hypothetical protein
MIRKGLRLRIRPALDFAGDGSGFRRVLPFRRAWLVIGILAVFDIIFLVPAITTFQQAATEWGKFDDLFDLVSALFLSAWLLGWSIAPLLMTTVLALMLFGREVIRVSPGKLRVFLGVPGIGVAASYNVKNMRNLRFERPPKKSGKSWRGSHIAFEYGANSFAFGSDLSGADVSEIRNGIQMASGQSIRRGDASAAELQGEWKPDVVFAEESVPEPLHAQAAGAADPVTLGSLSTIVLILANLVPLAGAAFMGWNLGNVMVLYWAESAVIGFFNVCKITVIGRWFALLAAPFFFGHFGAFMAVHFLFIYGIFVQGMQDNTGGDLSEVMQMFVDLWPALAALFISHALSFFSNFLGRKEYRGRTVNSQMSEPYSRIVFMHLVLIFGGGLTLVLGEPTPVLLIVIALKIWFDVKAHLKQRTNPEHDRQGEGQQP